MPRTKRTTGQQHPLLKNLCNQVFGKLRVIGLAGTTKTHKALWLCRCECGKWKIIPGVDLRTGKSVSCGCGKGHHTNHFKIHGMATSPEYDAFCHAKYRCQNPTDRNYKNYGARGIEFRLPSFESFLDYLGKRPTHRHSLNRIDNNGHYEFGNIEWALPKPQMRNTRANRFLTAFGRTQTFAAWYEETGIDRSTVRDRLKIGWCPECAVTIKPHKGKCSHIGQEA